MSKILEYALRYFIIALIFMNAVLNIDLNILYYSIFLIYIILVQITIFKKLDENFIFINLLLQILISFYLYNGNFILLSLLLINPIMDIYKNLNIKKIIIINLVYLIPTIILLNEYRDIENMIFILLMYLFAANIGILLKEKNRRVLLDMKVDELIIEKKLAEIQNSKKDTILKDIYITEERNRISRDIHDSVGHSLSAIIIQLSAIEKIALQNSEKASELSGNLRRYAVDSLEEIREVLRQTKPKNTGENELIIMIENLIEENRNLRGININFKFSATRYPLEYNIQNTIFNGVKEFISNSIKHGNPSKININLFFKELEVVLNMKDDGIGTDKIINGIGLRALEERVRENKGKLVVESSKNNGFSTNIVFKR